MLIAYESRPPDFKVQVEVAACYVQVEENLLLLQQSIEKSESGTWGVPAGKLEHTETPLQAARRELFEETGILATSSQLKTLGCLYMRKPSLDYIFYLFAMQMDQRPEVRLSREHQNFLWANFAQIENLHLMMGGKEGIFHYLSRCESLSKKNLT